MFECTSIGLKWLVMPSQECARDRFAEQSRRSLVSNTGKFPSHGLGKIRNTLSLRSSSAGLTNIFFSITNSSFVAVSAGRERRRKRKKCHLSARQITVKYETK